MARELTTAMQDAVTAQEQRPFFLFKAEFDGGDLRLWSGYGDLTFESEVYTGAGNLLSFSEIKESTNVQANGMEIELSGIPTEIIEIANNENYQDRPFTMWIGAFDEAGAIIVDPIQAFKGKMDVMAFEEGDTDARAVLSVENILIDLQRDKTRNYTHEDQQLISDGDTGFSKVTALQEKEVIWGS